MTKFDAMRFRQILDLQKDEHLHHPIAERCSVFS
jgi:hypothetical protein